MKGKNTLDELKDTCAASGFRGEIREREEMRKHTSLAIGGPADFYIVPADEDDLIRLLEIIDTNEVPVHTLGEGSNLLISDEGVRGIIIRVGRQIGSCSINGYRLTVGAGFPLMLLAREAAEKGLSGLEFGAGIPGTVGGAVVMNAGCRGQEISRIVRRVRVYEAGRGPVDLGADECRFGYRTSRFLQEGSVLLKVDCELRPERKEIIEERMRDDLSWRKQALPLEYPSAGSIFKNPPGDYAGRLIEAAGLKGKRIGDAQISEKQANVIINRGSALAADVEELIKTARRKVREYFGVELELEIEIWK